MKRKTTILLIVFLNCTWLFSQENKVLTSWLDELVVTTKNTVGFSPPVVSRALCYYGLSMLYATHFDDSMVVNKLNQLSFSDTIPFVFLHKKTDKQLLVNSTSYYFCQIFYNSMPIENKNAVYQLKINLEKKHNKKQIAIIDSFAKKIATEMYARSMFDGGFNGHLKNFPTEFTPQNCEACWVRSPPSFFPSQLPYWGQNKNMLSVTFQEDSIWKPFIFSKDTASQIYQDSKEMYAYYQQLPDSAYTIARYWNDDPGYSGTPSGHIVSISNQLLKNEKIDLPKSAKILATLGVALNEVNIITWRLKYKYIFIRPITYIHRYISKEFSPIIPTPPFPEFPSGHSCLSGAGITVLQYFFTDKKNILDSTHTARVDIDGRPRVFTDFNEMKKEISFSRWLGGIHFKNTLEKSVMIGDVVATKTISFFNFEK